MNKTNAHLTVALLGALILSPILTGCKGGDDKGKTESKAAEQASPAPAQPKVKITESLRDEASGERLRRHHKDEFGFEFKTEVMFKGATGTRERNRMGRVSKLEVVFENGKRMERVVVDGKPVSKFYEKDRLVREITRQESVVISIVEHKEDGSKLFWRPASEKFGNAVLYFEDGKTARLTIPDKGNSHAGPFEIHSREGKLVYRQVVSSAWNDRHADVTFYRADGTTVWYEQSWVFPAGSPVLRQVREYSENGSLVREVLPSSAVRPDTDANAPMELKEYKDGTVIGTTALSPDLMSRTRQTPAPNAVAPTDPLERILSRPTDNLTHLLSIIQQQMPDESLLDKTLKD